MEKKNDPIQNIEELIIQLEKINLSPLPSSKKENEKFKKDANLIMSKIVLNFDSIFKNKLRLNLESKNNKYKSLKTVIIKSNDLNNQNNINIINPSVSNNQINQFLLDNNINNNLNNINKNQNINNNQINNNNLNINNNNINNKNNNNNNNNLNINNLNINNLNINSINNNNNNNNVINHYWTYISKHFSSIPSVEFCLKYEKYNSFNNKYEEKGMLWILISINEKSFHKILSEIYNQNLDKKYYEKNSLLITKKNEILNLTKKLQSIHLIEIEKFDDYLKFKNNLLKQQSIKIKEEVDDEEIIFSPEIISKQFDNNFFPNLPPIVKKATNQNNFNSMFFSESETEFLKNNPNNNYTNNIGLESIFLAMNDDDNNVNENHDNNNVHERKKTIDKNNNIIINNSIKNNNIFNQPEREIVKINKIYDFNANYIINNFYNFENIIINSNDLSVERKKSSFFDKNKFIEIKNEINIEKNTKYELKLNPPKNYFYPLDKNYTILNVNINNIDNNSIDNSNDKIITKFDIVKYKNKDIHLTNSILYYLNNFYHKKSYFKFSTNNSNKKPISLENQNYQCYFCKKVFKYFFGFIPRENIYWCSYYLKYICEDCLSEEFSVIPDFIIKNWNFKKYPISKKAKNILEEWYEKPVIYITKKDQICKNNNELYQAILLKKKIHIIFDLMKCDEKENIIKNILGKYDYLVLREYFFSLRDLVEINDMSFFDKINEFERKLENHILNECKICHYEGGKCLMCENNEKIYAFDVENVIYCNKCKLLFHKNCVEFHSCFINKNIKL